MKGPAIFSMSAHAALLFFGLFSLSGPKPLTVADVEALPIDIVPIEDVTRAVQGEKKADISEKPAPKATTKKESVPEARNVGDATNDDRSERPEEVAEKVVPTKRADAAPKSEKQEVAKEAKPEPVKEEVEKSDPVKTTEVAAKNEKPEPVKEEPKEEAKEAEAIKPKEEAKKEEKKVEPEKKQEDAKPKTAETQDRKKPEEKPKKEKTATSATENKKSPVDEIAALLNKEKPSASGAKRSTQQASLGTKKPGNAGKLSQSEMDALRGAIEKCWSVQAGMEGADDIRVTVRFRLTKQGEIDGRPEVESTGGDSSARRTFTEGARRAVIRCAPYALPVEKYETWSEVVVNFDPSQMF